MLGRARIAGVRLAACAVVAGLALLGGGCAPSTHDGSIIGKVDTRVPSNDPRIARIGLYVNSSWFVPNCTTWIASNGAFVTAGHCVTTSQPVAGPCTITAGFFDQVEFNVPLSRPGGRPVPPTFVNSYNVDDKSVQCQYIPGDLKAATRVDWAIFRVRDNHAGSPIDRQQRLFPGQEIFLRPTQVEPTSRDGTPDEAPAMLRVTGFGTDGPAPCWGDAQQEGDPACAKIVPLQNNLNITQQTATGSLNGTLQTADGKHRLYVYSVDTTAGSAGSPVLINGTNQAIGIHVSGGVAPLSAVAASDEVQAGAIVNYAMPFSLAPNKDPALQTALHAFPGTLKNPVIPGDRIVYVDRAAAGAPPPPPTNPAAFIAQGNIFAPYGSLAEAFNATAKFTSPSMVSVVAGTYGGTIDDGTVAKPADPPEPANITVNMRADLDFEMPVGNVVLWEKEM